MPLLPFDEEVARIKQTQDARDYVKRMRAEAEADQLAELPGVNVRQQLAEEYVPPVWRIDGLHIASSFTTITAPKKTGKSTLMLNLMKSLLDGQTFIGQPVLAPEKNVGYWNMELDPNVWLQWVQDIKLANDDRLIAEHLRGQKFPLWHPEMRKRVVDWLQVHEIEVLIIDPGAKLLRGWPTNGSVENSNDVVAEVCQVLQEIKREGAVTDLFVPLHTGHASQGESQHSRGAIVWQDEPDHLWNLWSKRIVDDEIRHFNAFGRNVDFDTVLIDYDPKTHRYQPEANPDALLNLGRARSVVLALAKHGELGTADLRKRTKGVGNDVFPEAVEEAERRGWVKIERVGRSEIHRLTDSEEVRAIAAFHGSGVEEL